MKNQNPTARLENIIVQDLGEELLLYNSQTDKAYSLNSTAAFVWSICDGEKSALEIEKAMEKKFSGRIGKEFVWLTIDLLRKNELLITAGHIEADFSGLARRKLIQKAGMASIAALPVIASLTAPKAVAAASGVVGACNGPGGQTCTNIGGPCTVTGSCIPAGGGNFFFCSVGGVCLGYGTCFGTGVCTEIV